MASADLYPVAGARFYIGTATSTKASDFVAADFASQTWTEVDGWQNMGNLGDTASVITTELINRGRAVKQKGTKNAGSMQNQFAIIPTDAGQVALIAAANSNSNFSFRIVFNDAPAATSATVTITIAAPGVVTDTAHGYTGGETVSYSTTGALPTGLSPATTYYVKYVDANTYQLSATKGGSAITTSGTQSGVHTRTSVPYGTTSYFVGMVMSASEQGGGANTTRMVQCTVELNSNIVTVSADD